MMGEPFSSNNDNDWPALNPCPYCGRSWCVRRSECRKEQEVREEAKRVKLGYPPKSLKEEE